MSEGVFRRQYVHKDPLSVHFHDEMFFPVFVKLYLNIIIALLNFILKNYNFWACDLKYCMLHFLKLLFQDMISYEKIWMHVWKSCTVLCLFLARATLLISHCVCVICLLYMFVVSMFVIARCCPMLYDVARLNLMAAISSWWNGKWTISLSYQLACPEPQLASPIELDLILSWGQGYYYCI